MKGKLILVGASGAIGDATLKAAQKSGLTVLPTYETRTILGGVRFNIERDAPDMLNIGGNDVLILFAAHSDQEWVRTHPVEARKLNVFASARLAEAANQARALVVFISSEAVFGRSLETGWTERSEPCPTTEYGRQKLEMEKILQSLGGACVVRTGWNVSYRLADRCVVRSTYESLRDGSARLAEDNIFSISDVNDTARLLIEVVVTRASGIVHAVSGIPVTRTGLAEEIIRNCANPKGLGYKKIRFKDLNFSEPKPARSWLSTSHEIHRRLPPFASPPEVIAKKVRFLDAPTV